MEVPLDEVQEGAGCHVLTGCQASGWPHFENIKTLEDLYCCELLILIDILITLGLYTT